ncbi:MAG: hypothetical protein RLZZ156_2180, partial [Deinococcota bacterium]
MRKRLIGIATAALLVAGIGQSNPNATGFRVQPYLLAPSQDGMTVVWFSTLETSGTLVVDGKTYTSSPQLVKDLEYSQLEESERPKYSDMFENKNVKHTVRISGLEAGQRYAYRVTQGNETVRGSLETAPSSDSRNPIRFVVLSDSETEPDGRTIRREWGNTKDSPAAQDANSTGRPAGLSKDSSGRELYFSTETEGYKENIRTIKERKPHFVAMPGDLVQGGGYQRAWDEFFYHNAGKFDTLLSNKPLLPALGNWEMFGARNGGYTPAAV